MNWTRIGILNTLEHALTRFADAGTTLLLLWGLSPEAFGRLAVSQAFVAPLLLLCVAPENVLYRDFHLLREDRVALSGKIRAYRRFGWWKLACLAGLALALSFSGFYGTEGDVAGADRALALLWAVLLALAPQVSGADRAFLRLDLRLRELNAATLFQKAGLLGGSALALRFFPGSLAALVAAAGASLLASAGYAWWRARLALPRASGPSRTFQETIESLRGFSIWSHFSGVVLGWVQTMDLYFLGVFGLPAREAGLYGAALKLANLAYAVPSALVNLFGIWVGQQKVENAEEASLVRKRALTRTGGLLGVLAAQALLLWALSPWIFGFFSRGRWADGEILAMREWLGWMLLGSLPIAGGFLLDFWLLVRARARDSALAIYLPWLLASAAVYSAAAATGGTMSAARANAAVGVIFALLLLRRWRRCAG